MLSNLRGGQTGNLPIRCSAEALHRSACGYRFPAILNWVRQVVPGVVNL